MSHPIPRLTTAIGVCVLALGATARAAGDPPAAAPPAEPDVAAVALCDRLAAHPEDPGRVAPGIETAAMDKPAALAACERAVAEAPGNARSRYQLARVLFYSGLNERAMQEMKVSADAGYAQAQFVYGTFVVRGRPGAPRDLCVAERYWRESAAGGRQAARVQYLRHALKGRFAGCTPAAPRAELAAMLEVARREAEGFYERLLIEDLGEALAAVP